MAAGRTIQSAGDSPTRVQTNAGAITDTATPILSPTTPLKISNRSGHVGVSVTHSRQLARRFLRSRALNVASLFRDSPGYAECVRRFDAELKRGAKSVWEKSETPRAVARQTSRVGAPARLPSQHKTVPGFSNRLISLAIAHTLRCCSSRERRSAKVKPLAFQFLDLDRGLLQAEGQQRRRKRLALDGKREIRASCVKKTQGDLSSGSHKLNVSVIVGWHDVL